MRPALPALAVLLLASLAGGYGQSVFKPATQPAAVLQGCSAATPSKPVTCVVGPETLSVGGTPAPLVQDTVFQGSMNISLDVKTLEETRRAVVALSKLDLSRVRGAFPIPRGTTVTLRQLSLRSAGVDADSLGSSTSDAGLLSLFAFPQEPGSRLVLEDVDVELGPSCSSLLAALQVRVCSDLLPSGGVQVRSIHSISRIRRDRGAVLWS